MILVIRYFNLVALVLKICQVAAPFLYWNFSQIVLNRGFKLVSGSFIFFKMTPQDYFICRNKCSFKWVFNLCTLWTFSIIKSNPFQNIIQFSSPIIKVYHKSCIFSLTSEWTYFFLRDWEFSVFLKCCISTIGSECFVTFALNRHT